MSFDRIQSASPQHIFQGLYSQFEVKGEDLKTNRTVRQLPSVMVEVFKNIKDNIKDFISNNFTKAKALDLLSKSGALNLFEKAAAWELLATSCARDLWDKSGAQDLLDKVGSGAQDLLDKAGSGAQGLLDKAELGAQDLFSSFGLAKDDNLKTENDNIKTDPAYAKVKSLPLDKMFSLSINSLTQFITKSVSGFFFSQDQKTDSKPDILDGFNYDVPMEELANMDDQEFETYMKKLDIYQERVLSGTNNYEEYYFGRGNNIKPKNEFDTRLTKASDPEQISPSRDEIHPKDKAKQFVAFLYQSPFQEVGVKGKHVFSDLNALSNQAFKAADDPVSFAQFEKDCSAVLQKLNDDGSYTSADLKFFESMVSLILYTAENNKALQYLMINGELSGDKGKEYITAPIEQKAKQNFNKESLNMQELAIYFEISVLRKLAAVSDGITSSVNKESYSESKIKHPVDELGKVIPKMANDLATYGDILVAASDKMPVSKEPSREKYKSLGIINPQQMLKGLGERFQALSKSMNAEDSSFSMIQQVSEQAKTTESIGEEMYMQMRASRRP